MAYVLDLFFCNFYYVGITNCIRGENRTEAGVAVCLSCQPNRPLSDFLVQTYIESARPVCLSAGQAIRPTAKPFKINATYTIIKGHLEARTLTWAISTNFEGLVSEVNSALSWT